MMERFAVSPFGGKGMSRAQFLVNERVLRARGSQERQKGESSATQKADKRPSVDKWKLIRSLTEAKSHFGLSDRAIVVLEALASFHTERHFGPVEGLVVFPSNAELSVRARGMAPATLRRHLAALVSAGLLMRRDSANGKRYARRDESGVIEAAFGFDLAPLALRAAEIEEAAAMARKEAASLRALRSEVTIHLRDISKLVEAAFHEGRGNTFECFARRLEALSGRLTRNVDFKVLETRRNGLLELRRDLEAAYLAGAEEIDPPADEASDSAVKMSACARQNERHIHNSESDQQIEINKGEMIEDGFAAYQPTLLTAETTDTEVTENRDLKDRAPKQDADDPPSAPKTPPIALDYVLSACPQMHDYVPGGLRAWHDLTRAAETVRMMLGISTDAWLQARKVMGELDAAIVVAAILERVAEIRSPGGYLRHLSSRAATGRFSVKPMLAALAAARLRERTTGSAA
ncbi:replication initiation protein [Aquamicrobium sp. LC103]|nr:replication initiation protein [Aquamicrobium sp. LC103]